VAHRRWWDRPRGSRSSDVLFPIKDRSPGCLPCRLGLIRTPRRTNDSPCPNVGTTCTRCRSLSIRAADRRKRISLWTPVGRGGSIPQSGRRPSSPCHARDPPLLPTCITMHSCSPADHPQIAVIRAGERHASSRRDSGRVIPASIEYSPRLVLARHEPRASMCPRSVGRLRTD